MKKQEPLTGYHQNWSSQEYSSLSEEGNRRKFLYQSFFESIDKEAITMMKEYLKNNKPNFPLLHTLKSRNQPLLTDFSKKSPITPFTLYEDAFIILQCKKNIHEINKTSFFNQLSLKIGRTEKYLVERVKKKYPKMTIQDLKNSILSSQPIRFGINKQFIKPKNVLFNTQKSQSITSAHNHSPNNIQQHTNNQQHHNPNQQQTFKYYYQLISELKKKKISLFQGYNYAIKQQPKPNSTNTFSSQTLKKYQNIHFLLLKNKLMAYNCQQLRKTIAKIKK